MEEGGLWGYAAEQWKLRGALRSRVYGIPAVLMTACARRAVDGDLARTARIEVLGYLDDAHLSNPVLAGPQGQRAARSMRDELRSWARAECMRETSVLISLHGVWNAFLEAAQRRPGGHDMIPRYSTLSLAERKLVLTVDTDLTQLAAQRDSDEMSLDDMAVCQAASGYSDLGSDVKSGVVINGLLVGAGLGAVPGGADAPAAYRAISRSLLAIAHSRTHTPGSQITACMLIWIVTNGRHRVAERAIGLDHSWLAHHWPGLEKNRKDWDAVEEELCGRVRARLASDGIPVDSSGGCCEHCGQLSRWSTLIHDVLHQPPGAACAITDYLRCTNVRDPMPDSGDAPRSPESDCAGAIALLVQRFVLNGALYDLMWILAGVIWFREALPLRGCVVELASLGEHGASAHRAMTEDL